MKTLSQTAYKSIRQRLITGKLPLGSKISEAALARDLGVSRAPIREAIRELANEGLVQQVPNVGSFVQKPNRRELEELFELREWLEAAAAERAAEKINTFHLNELEQACNKMRSAVVVMREMITANPEGTDIPPEMHKSFEIADATFHMILIESCGNRSVVKILSNKHVLSRIWNALPSDCSYNYYARMYGKHARIFRAIKRGDRQKARDCITRHIREGLDDVLGAFDRIQLNLQIKTMTH